MSTDGIAYNHYGIKYVLKRLGDLRSSRGSTHMEGERTERREREGRERKTCYTHIAGKRNKWGLCERNEKQRQCEAVRDHHGF